MLLCSVLVGQSQRPPWGGGGPCTYVSSYSPFRWMWRANCGRLTAYHSTTSDEHTHPTLAATANSFSMSAGRSTVSSGLPLHLRELKNVHYDGGVPWMLIPDDDGVLHIAILTEISPTVTRNVATNVHLNLFTKYVLVCFQVLEI